MEIKADDFHKLNLSKHDKGVLILYQSFIKTLIDTRLESMKNHDGTRIVKINDTYLEGGP